MYLDVAVNQEQIGRLLIEVNQYLKIVYSLVFNADLHGLYGSWKTWKVMELLVNTGVCGKVKKYPKTMKPFSYLNVIKLNLKNSWKKSWKVMEFEETKRV